MTVTTGVYDKHAEREKARVAVRGAARKAEGKKTVAPGCIIGEKKSILYYS